MSLTTISVRGAREHNLKDVDIDIPRDTLTVITILYQDEIEIRTGIGMPVCYCRGGYESGKSTTGRGNKSQSQ